MSATHAGARIVLILLMRTGPQCTGIWGPSKLAPDHCDGLDHVLGLVGTGSELRREQPHPDSKPQRNERPTKDTRLGCLHCAEDSHLFGSGNGTRLL